jgi:hypothetical protein
VELNEWILKTVQNRLIVRLNVHKRVWSHYTDEFTAMLIAYNDEDRKLLGGLWIQVHGATIVDKQIWTSATESEWAKELEGWLGSNREDWRVKKEQVFTITEELQVGRSTSPLPPSSLLVVEYLALLQGILMTTFLSSNSFENRLLRTMAFRLRGIRKEGYQSVFAGIA